MSVAGYKPKYNKNSPYWKTDVYSTFMGYYVHRNIPPMDTDTWVIIDNPRYQERPDLLSYDLYGTPDLWWIFGIRNGFEDLIHDLKEGMTIVVPDRNTVADFL